MIRDQVCISQKEDVSVNILLFPASFIQKAGLSPSQGPDGMIFFSYI